MSDRVADYKRAAPEGKAGVAYTEGLLHTFIAAVVNIHPWCATVIPWQEKRDIMQRRIAEAGVGLKDEHMAGRPERLPQ